MHRTVIFLLFLVGCLLLKSFLPKREVVRIIPLADSVTGQELTHETIEGSVRVATPEVRASAAATSRPTVRPDKPAESVPDDQRTFAPKSSQHKQSKQSRGDAKKQPLDVSTALPQYPHFTKFRFPKGMKDSCARDQQTPPFTAVPSRDRLACIGAYQGPGGHTVEHWNERAKVNMSYHPAMNVLHGAVSPSRLMQQGDFLLHVGGLQRVSASTPPQTNVTIVEIGCGNGNLLFSMCPPSVRWKCFGTDFSEPMIEHGRRQLSWIDLRWGIGAGHVPSGVADLAISHAVVPYLTPQVLCEHVAEELRVLKPGGAAIFWMVSQKKFATMIHPDFWHGSEGVEVGLDANVALPFCTGLHEFVAEVDVFLDPNMQPKAAIYTVESRNGGWYGVRIIRSAKAFPPAHASDVDPILQSHPVHRYVAQSPTGLDIMRRYDAELKRFLRLSKISKTWENGRKVKSWVADTG